MVRYWSILRPISLGTYPETNKVMTIDNYDERIYVKEIGREAWGHIDYTEPLADDMAKAYNLVREETLPKKSKVAGSNGQIFYIDNVIEKFVVEVCSECGNEIFMRWDVSKDGFRSYCPHCGAVLMLCDECQHRDPNVDYADPEHSGSDNDCDWKSDFNGNGSCMMTKGLV